MNIEEIKHHVSVIIGAHINDDFSPPNKAKVIDELVKFIIMSTAMATEIKVVRPTAVPKPKMFLDSELPKTVSFPIHPETGEPWQDRMEELDASLKSMMANPSNAAIKATHEELVAATTFEEAAFIACPSEILGQTAKAVYACHPEVWALVDPEVKAKFDVQAGDQAEIRRAEQECREAMQKLAAEAAKQDVKNN